MDPLPVPSSLGEFRVLGVLGHGGSGTVYDAVWGPRRVALKVVSDPIAGTVRQRAQFLAEAQRLQTIAHPSVVKVLASGELPDGRPYLAMERLDGETLASLLSRGALPLVRALALFAELCGAVAALHDQGLIHRDLKPENVFIVAEQHAVLLDFGIAKELDAPLSTTTQVGGVRGTPAYMAPERFFGQPAGVATDIYELAVTLYAMLAGRLPWDDVADPEARLQPRPLEGVAAELDVEIRRAMSTRAQNRPPSALALLEAVRATAGGVAPEAPASTARLPQAPSQQQPPPSRPWFADRQPTTDRGRTPLAWAPTTQAQAPQAAPKPRRRWPLLVIGAVAVAGGVTAFVATRPAKPDAEDPVVQVPVVQLSKDKDPWQTSIPVDAAPPQPVVVAHLAEYRDEIAAAVPHLPRDTRGVLSVIYAELDSQQQMHEIIEELIREPRAQMLEALMPPCVKKTLGRAAWFVFGTPSVDSPHGVLIARGDWTRDDVEGCFLTDATRVAMPDGKKLFRLGKEGLVDFIDDHTIYVAMRSDLQPAQVHALATAGKAGPGAHLKELFADVSRDKAVGFAVDGNGVTFPDDAFPKGTDLHGFLGILPDGVDLRIVVDTHDERTAKQFEGGIKPQIDDTFANTDSAAVGKLTVMRDKTVVRIDGKLTSLMLGIISTQLK
jgi:serine/threonine protein kinase